MQIYDMLYSIVGIDYHKNEPCQRELVGAKPLHLAYARPFCHSNTPLGCLLLRKRELVGTRPLHLAYARPFCRLKAPLGLSLLRCAAQTRTCRGEAPPSCLRKTVLSLKHPTGAFIAPLRCANANLSGRGPSILLRKTVLSLKHPTGVFVASQTRTFENTPLSAGCKKK